MNGDWLAMGAVAALAAAGAARRRGSRAVGTEVSTPLDLPRQPKVVREPGFYYKPSPRPAVRVYGKPGGVNGHLLPVTRLHTWQFPSNPDDQFRSRMVVFDNMHHMGGYSWRPHNYDGSTYLEIGRSEALVDRMLAKRKPAAECVVAGNWSFRYDRDERRAHQAKRDAITKLHERASRGDLVVGAIHTGHLAGVEYPWSYRFTMAQPGTSSDNFDLDAWKSSWLGYKMPEPYLASWLEEIDGVPLSHLIELFRENEHSLPAPIVGLILGFPICTTASLV